MPLGTYQEPIVLNKYFGATEVAPPATHYVGLLLQLGQLSSALTAGLSYTSLLCSTIPAAFLGATSDVILLGTGTTTQTLLASGTWAANATSIPINSFVANATYGIGTPFVRCNVYTVAQEPAIGANSYARVAVTNNTTNWPAATVQAVSPGWLKQNGAAVGFPTASGSWGTVAGFLISDAASAGNLIAFGALSVAQAIGSGNTPSFAINALSITLV